HDEDEGGHDRPEDLERRVAVRVRRAPVVTMAVHEQEDQHRHLDEHPSDAGDVEDEIEEAVDVAAVRRDVCRKPPVQHLAAPILFSRWSSWREWPQATRRPSRRSPFERVTHPPGPREIPRTSI